MSLLASVRKSLVPVHPEGYLFLAVGVVATVVLARFWGPFGWIGTILTLWVAYFFRDPRRTTPLRDGLVVSPADGRISDVSLVLAPAELGLGEAPLRRVSVFMNVFDCHVNRAPVPGRIARMIYRPGKFINAELDKASEDNERSGLVIEGPRGAVGVVQIAGLIARRIVPFVKQGDFVVAGERFGLIRFGSRVDVYLPDTAQLLVGVGQTAVAGETILADLAAGNAGPIEFRAA